MYKYINALCNIPKQEFLKTNIDIIDELTNGLPIGKVVEIVGGPDTGKTALLFDIIEDLVDENIILYISTSSKSNNYINKRGFCKKDNFILCTSNKDTIILNTIDKLVDEVDLIIVDSISQILTENEIDGFDLNKLQDVPNILKRINASAYGTSTSLVVVNSLIFKNNEFVPSWNKQFDKYCSIRIRVDNYKNKEVYLIRNKVGGSIYGM